MTDESEFNRLLEKLVKQKMELFALLNKWYHLKFTHYPQIKHKYRQLFGSLENVLMEKRSQIYSVESRLQQIKRMLKVNFNIPKSYIQNTYNLNFSISYNIGRFENENIFDSVSSELNNGLIPECEINTNYEITQLYRAIIKKVHPDINGRNELFNKYWDNIQDAYKTKNLERIRLFYKLICDEFESETSDFNVKIEYLTNQIKEFEKSINLEKKKLSKILAEEPFCFDEKMNDLRWIKHRRKLLEAEIIIAERMIIKNRMILRDLLRENNLEELIENC